MITKIGRLKPSLNCRIVGGPAVTERITKLYNGRFSTSGPLQNDFPKSAEIVIAGAGSVGSSVAYHLSKFGHKDVVVLEQGSLGCGTSWHSVGLLGRLRNNALLNDFSKHATELYSNLEKDTGYGTGFKRCGAITVAKTKDRAIILRRLADKAKQFGTPCEDLSSSDALKLYPIMEVDDLQMALWSPEDGTVNASDVCASLMKGATQRGVRFIEGVGVQSVATDGKYIVGVNTERGYIHCDKFINCGGQWARDLGLRTDPAVNLPLHSCEHFYIVTKAMEGVHGMLPILRDHDSYLYIREWSGGLMAGGFEPIAKPTFYASGIPEKFEFQLLQEDWEQFDPIMQGCLNRIPSLQDAEVRQFVNGPESFTPDGKFMFGETAEVGNYFVAAGMNSNGIVCAAGMGKLTAELITHGSCSSDTSSIDIKRFSKDHNNKLFLRDRAVEVLGRHYSIDYPNSSVGSARPLKSSPLYSLLSEGAAVWGEYSGWEIPNYFADSKETEHSLTFGKPGWLSNVENEYKACKDGIGLADFSWQSKFEITSKSKENLIEELQYIFAKDVDVPTGHFVTTALLTKNGRYRGLSTLYRLSDDRFLLTTSPQQHNHILSWLSKNTKTSNSLEIKDVTAKYSSIGVLGPDSEKVLGELTRDSLELSNFGAGQCKILDLGYASNVILCRAILGSSDNWQAFVPSEVVQSLFQMLKRNTIASRTEFVGKFALNILRIEKGIPEYGVEFGPLTSPSELKEMSFVDITKSSNFIGKDAVEQNANHNKRFLVKLCLDEIDDENWAWGGEPVYADEKSIGSLSSVSYCFKRNKLIGFGVLDTHNVVSTSKNLMIAIAGKKYSASLID